MEKFKCSTCKIEKERENFFKNKSRNNNVSAMCKRCAAERDSQKYQNRKHYFSAYQKQYSQKFPEKRLAHILVNKALSSGELIKQKCIKCGNPDTEGHHEDYSKPLEVIWLCNKHHQRLHQMLRSKPASQDKE